MINSFGKRLRLRIKIRGRSHLSYSCSRFIGTMFLCHRIAVPKPAEYSHRGLKANTTYYYKIMSYEKAHWDIWINRPGEGSDTTERDHLYLNLSQFDSKTVTIGSSPLSSAKYYLLQRTDRKGAPYKDVAGAAIKTTGRFKLKDGKFLPDSNRYYRVIAYNNSKKGKVISMETLVTNEGSAPKRLKISTAKNKAEITLNWKRERGGLTGYKVYRSTDGKQFNWVDTKVQYPVRGKVDTVYWTDKSVDSNKTYYYRVIKYKVRMDTDGLYHITYFSKPSKTVHVRTELDVTAHATREYFVSNWPNVMVPSKGDSPTLNPVDSTSAVKYKLVNGKTLEIHVYFEHLGIKQEQKRKLERFKNGVINMWSEVEFPGKNPNPGDFPSSEPIAFTTKLVYHTKGDAGLGKKQKFIKVYFGGKECLMSAPEFYWYHASPPTNEDGHAKWSHASENFAIYMPSDAEVKDTISGVFDMPKTGAQYNNTAGHELGHILGLDDGYYPLYGDVTTDRLDASAETTKGTNVLTFDLPPRRLHDNIMSNSEEVSHALPNDIEMILNAYAISVQHSNGEAADLISWQNYREFDMSELSYIRSNRIHSKAKYFHS